MNLLNVLVVKMMALLCLALLPVLVYSQPCICGEKKLSFYFRYNSADLDSSAALVQQELQWLSAVVIDTVLVEGNTDKTGTDQYNHGLGYKRARTVENFLKGFLPPAYSTILVSYGESKPAYEHHAGNRRVDVVIVYRTEDEEQIVDEQNDHDFDSTTVGRIQVGKYGTRVLLPRNLFYPNHLEDVKLYINEATTACDILNQRLNTISVDNECLQTAGMIFLKAFVDGVEVQPAEGMKVEIQIPAKLIDPDMKLYESSNDRWALSTLKLTPTTINGEMFYVFKTKWKSGWNIDKVIGPCLDAGPVVKVTFGETQYMQMYSATDTYLNAVELTKRKHRFPTFRDATSSSIYIRVRKGGEEYEFKGKLSELKYSARNQVYVLRKRDMHKLNHWEMIGTGSAFVECN